MKVLAIIPARGGSKGLPGKNIKDLGGKPLIAHAIECGLDSTLVTKTILSTDDNDIADIAKGYNVEVLKRPDHLADDQSNVVDTVLHVVNEYNQNFDIIILLQPTSPLRTSKDLDNIIKLLMDNDEIDGIISVVPMDDVHPARMYKLMNDTELIPLLEAEETLRRQDIKPVYLSLIHI